MIKVRLSFNDETEPCPFTFRNFEEFDEFVSNSEENIKIYDYREVDGDE